MNLSLKIADGTGEELEQRVIDWLTAHADAYDRQRRVGYEFNSSEHLVLREGTKYRANIWDMTVDDLQPGQCFLNAFMLSQINPRWTYCEGWALMPFSIPTHHAWVVDEDGEVQDPTWKPLYRKYRDADANRGSKQPYSGAAAYIGVSPASHDHHLHWTLSRGHPNLLSLGEMDVDAVVRLGVDAALKEVAPY